MTRDCATARINRLHLLDLLDASGAPERQMVTIRMPALRVQDLDRVEIAKPVVPASIASPGFAGARSTPGGSAESIASPGFAGARSTPGGSAESIARPPDVHAESDVMLIGVICTLSMAVCSALAWFG